MQRLPVDSSDIVAIGYDAKARLLEIEFKEGRIYQYADVEPHVYDLFTRADSYGEFFYASINKHYRYKRVNETEKPATSDKLAFVTGNARKLRDLVMACEPFGIEVEQLDLPVDEIQSHDAEDIAVKKAKEAYKLAVRPVVINDAYWNILALRGFPGAYMSYITEWLKPEDFLALLAGKSDRTVICTETLVYYDGKHTKVFVETYHGTIIDTPRGSGQSIEQLVVLEGQMSTIAELKQQERMDATDSRQPIWHDFAKWYNLQRRIMMRTIASHD